MSNKIKKVPALTPEQKAENLSRAFLQEFNSIAQGILYNIVKDCYGDEPVAVAEWSLAVAAAFIKQAGPAAQETFKELMEKEGGEA